MPTVMDAIVQGVLTGPERKIFDVLSKHKEYMFSTSLEDLSQLALWCNDPSAEEPPRPIEVDSNSSININSKFKISENFSTYTLRTISTALSSLARTDRIWRGELYFGEGKSKNGRIYYGAKGIEKILEEQFRKVSQTKRSATNYKTLAPGD